MLPVLLLAGLLAQAPPRQLLIVGPTLHQFEDGPRIYSDHRYVPGETVFFSFQVRGYAVTPGDEKKVRLTWRIDALDAAGVRLVEETKGEVDTVVFPEDKDWAPKVRYSVLIPPHAGAGDYRLAASVKDEVGLQTVSAVITFPVQARAIEPSDTLVVRNFRFLRAEQDTQPLTPASYHVGDSLWAKFDITGFRTAEENRFKVSYGISILTAGGKLLFSQEEAAVDEGAPFYPKRHVPALVSLTIQPGTPAAEYIMQVTVRDELGAQSCETKQYFRVE